MFRWRIKPSPATGRPGPPHRPLSSELSALRETLLLAILLSPGCGQRMDDQPRVEALEASQLPSMRSEARRPPEHAVSTAAPLAMNDPAAEDAGLLTGRVAGRYLTEVPAPWQQTEALTDLLHRGHSRFEIYCAPCHGLTGSGDGRVAQRGFPFPPSYHTPRLRRKPLGYLFAVVTRGHGRMPPYGDILSSEDRWAVAAYVRTLQLSQYAPLEWLAESERQRIEQP